MMCVALSLLTYHAEVCSEEFTPSILSESRDVLFLTQLAIHLFVLGSLGCGFRIFCLRTFHSKAPSPCHTSVEDLTLMRIVFLSHL